MEQLIGKTIESVTEDDNIQGKYIDIKFTDGSEYRFQACCCLSIERKE